MNKLRVIGGLAVLVVSVLCWAHLGFLLEVPGSHFLRFVAAVAGVSTMQTGLVLLYDARMLHLEQKAEREEMASKVYWPVGR